MKFKKKIVLCGFAFIIIFGIGDSLSFPAEPSPPVVITDENVETLAAIYSVVKGSIYSDGGSPVVVRGVCYGTSPYVTIESDNFKEDTVSNTGIISVTLTDLLPNTLYYARVYAANSVGFGYGNEVSFKTLTVGTLFLIFSGDGKDDPEREKSFLLDIDNNNKFDNIEILYILQKMLGLR